MLNSSVMDRIQISMNVETCFRINNPSGRSWLDVVDIGVGSVSSNDPVDEKCGWVIVARVLVILLPCNESRLYFIFVRNNIPAWGVIPIPVSNTSACEAFSGIISMVTIIAFWWL